MENIGRVIASSDLTKPHNHTNGQPRYDDASQSEIESYQERLYLIIDDSFNLSSQTPTDIEKAARTESWSRALMGVVPEGDLQRTFDHAFKHRKSSYPISAYDMKDAHVAMIEEAEAARQAEHREFMRRQDEANLLADRFECQECFNVGFRYDDVRRGPNPQMVRCDRCKYWEFGRGKLVGGESTPSKG